MSTAATDKDSMMERMGKLREVATLKTRMLATSRLFPAIHQRSVDECAHVMVLVTGSALHPL